MKKILFVCLGNICRSSTAEGVMLHLLKEAGLEKEFVIDSAGILSYHQGELPDSRMRAHAARRGYNLVHRSRPVLKIFMISILLSEWTTGTLMI
jgi:protein-tyrosine phosphatase